jgi:hypothetical protein
MQPPAFRLFIAPIVIALITGASGVFSADGCPTSAAEISTDRPDVFVGCFVYARTVVSCRL